ncbi:hypothetical protein COU53_01665 [Candidatus Pacearchaeota archaeon CG10_big_fil_rev_8_21_14_0_10_30_48]|nr:MAG: hypothetical protein COU53_01665 [Candidatus Pacearchaeota archaeon CG10_big_fil_rev_8_21_14_0_10_30_48]
MIFGYKVICKEILKKDLKDCSIAIQGLGAVGMPLAEKLLEEGCKVIGSDVDNKKCKIAKKKGVKIVSVKKILFEKVDILSPCAFGEVINKKTIPKLKCKIIAGGANNILENEISDNKKLLKRNLIFVPDFVINSGGFLQALIERRGGSVKEAKEESIIIAKQLQRVIDHSRKNKLSLLESAFILFD